VIKNFKEKIKNFIVFIIVKYFKERREQKQRDFFYQELDKFLKNLNSKIKENHFKETGQIPKTSTFDSWNFENHCIDKAIFALGSFLTYRDQRMILEASRKSKSKPLPKSSKKKSNVTSISKRKK
jgi:hypothetical protein